MFLALIFIFGLIIGSFLNSIIYRLRQGDSFVKGRSFCPHCRRRLAWNDLIPVLSFIFLRGKCRVCHKPISWQYPLLEISIGILFTLIFFLRTSQLSPDYVLLIRDWIYISFLAIIFVYDLKWKLILDKVTVPAMVVSVAFIVVSGELSAWLAFLGAAALSGGFFLIQFLLSGGRWIGGGDIRLGFLVGLMVGWPAVLVALLVAYVVGALVSLVLIGTRAKQWSSEIPFGTFLSLGTIVALLYGQEIINWYMHIL